MAHAQGTWATTSTASISAAARPPSCSTSCARPSTRRASCSALRKVSSETNPNHLIPEYLEALQGRVQRLSVGVQSFDDGLLKQMDRYDKYGSAEEIFERIKVAAPYFTSLNVDMIFNFPLQTEGHAAPTTWRWCWPAAPGRPRSTRSWRRRRWSAAWLPTVGKVDYTARAALLRDHLRDPGRRRTPGRTISAARGRSTRRRARDGRRGSRRGGARRRPDD